jgi:hypothetical protein
VEGLQGRVQLVDGLRVAVVAPAVAAAVAAVAAAAGAGAGATCGVRKTCACVCGGVVGVSDVNRFVLAGECGVTAFGSTALRS